MELKLFPEDIGKIVNEAAITYGLVKNIQDNINSIVIRAIDSYDTDIKTFVNQVIKILIQELVSMPQHKRLITNLAVNSKPVHVVRGTLQLITDEIVKRITPKVIDDILKYSIQKLRF